MANKRKATSTLKKGRSFVMDSVKNVHNQVLETTEDLIEVSVVTGEKYQKIAAKAIKKSEPLITKQVDIMFDTLEELYDQYEYGTQRILKLLGIEDQVELARNVGKSVVKTAQKRFGKNVVSFAKTTKGAATQTIKAVSKKKAKAEKKAKAAAEKVVNTPTAKKAKKAKKAAKAKAAKASKTSKAVAKKVKKAATSTAKKASAKATGKVGRPAKATGVVGRPAKATGKVGRPAKATGKVGRPAKATGKVGRPAKVKAASKATVSKSATRKVGRPAKAKVTATTARANAVRKAIIIADSLQKINGVGPKMETAFNKIGIYTYSDLTTYNKKSLTEAVEKVYPSARMANAGKWIQTAKRYAK